MSHGSEILVPSSAHIADTAGLIDGEGSITIALDDTRCSNSGLPRRAPVIWLQVSSTDEALIDWLRETWGTGYKIISNRTKQRPHHKTGYCWKVRGRWAARILRQVEPHIRIKRAQLGLALEYAEMVGTPGAKIGPQRMQERLAYKQRMHNLNKRGIA